MACENTAEATRGGLASGMTAVELDISMSQDKVIKKHRHTDTDTDTDTDTVTDTQVELDISLSQVTSDSSHLIAIP